MNVILTTYDGAILGPIARLLGWILEGIYYVLSQIGIENTGICIILLTFIVNGLMIPLQIKQQKFSKMSSIMNPEIQAIQKKYKDKKDQASQQQMSIETQAVYQKYGVSPASGCLPLLITMPILFALYRVIYNIPAYVDQVYSIYEPIANQLIDLGVTVDTLANSDKIKEVIAQTYVITDAVKNAAGEGGSQVSYYIDILGQYNKEAWNVLAGMYPDLKNAIVEVSKESSHINYFLGMNLADKPVIPFLGGNPLKLGVLIPVLSVITQFISTKLSMANAPQQDLSDNPTANSMKMMNNIMPFITGAMCFMFPIGVGLYWVAGNVFRIFQALFINIYFDHMDMDEMMQKNIEKNRKKREKLGLDTMSDIAKINVKKASNDVSNKKEQEKKVNASSVAKNKTKKTEYVRPNNKKYKEGSIASYANMLSRDDTK